MTIHVDMKKMLDQGFLVVRQCVPEDQLEPMRQHGEQMLERQPDARLPSALDAGYNRQTTRAFSSEIQAFSRTKRKRIRPYGTHLPGHDR
jgi:hypothetical protein